MTFKVKKNKTIDIKRKRLYIYPGVKMELEGRIVVDPGIMLGKPVIRGTRITVELILERLQSGETVEQIADSLPTIESEDVHAAIEYAIDSLRREKVYVTSQERARV